MNTVGLILYPAADMAKAKAFFTTLLGSDPYADSPYYVGFKAGNVKIGLVQKDRSGLSGALAYVDVADINAALATLLDAGAEKVEDVRDVANGLLVASVKDLDGTPIGLRQHPK